MKLMKSMFSAMIIVLLFAVSANAQYDYFKNAQYPGTRRKDVSLDKVKQYPGDGYQRREVQWWPKQGVDYVEAPKGVQLRTWTVRENTSELTAENSKKVKWWPVALRGKKQFKAHLLGFRGIGSKIGSPFFKAEDQKFDGKGFCPAVVLRLEDGRKRCFTRGSFTDADQQYIIDLYEKEMDRIHKSLEPAPTKIRPDTLAKFPQIEFYKPGTAYVESAHFVATSGSEPPRDGIGSPWLDDEKEAQCAIYRKSTMRVYEDYWAYNEYAGHLMPYWEREERYKYSVGVGGTRVNGTQVTGRGNGGGYGACTTGGGNWRGLYHEWGHGSNKGGMISIGGGETQCDAHQTMADPTVTGKMMFQNEKPWKNLFWGAYPGGLGWAMIGDSPNWSYAAVAVLPPLMTDGEHTPMHAIARLGQERGIFKNGVRGVGDFLGQVGARFAEFDTELETGLRKTFITPNRSHLMAVDREKGHYRSPVTESPEPFGVNLVKLVPEKGARKITVDFMGHYDGDTFSDWRACLVAVDSQSKCRYTPLWNKGKMSIDIEPGDKRFWLTVTATPTALISAHPTGRFDAGWVYQGGFAYRYPYDVKLTGCVPGTPNQKISDNDNLGLVGKHHPRISFGPWPHPSDTPAYFEMQKSLKALQKRIGEESADSSKIKYLLENSQGRRHPNGGGWVAKSATVDSTAYVGPDAMVLDGAMVLNNAAIEDYAIVTGPEVVIKDNAKVFRKAIVKGKVELSDYARVCRNIISVKELTECSTPEQRNEVFKDRGCQMQAIYSCDRPETILLEDCFQERFTGPFFFGAHSTDLMFYDGTMFGKPGFCVDGDHRSFTFDGRSQYAELPGEVADVGKGTFDITFKYDAKRGTNTLYDFGSSKDNRFALSITSRGKLELVIIKDGKSEKLSTSAIVSSGKWINCRVEMDGNAIKLWANGKLEAKTDSTFVPADAFVPGKERISYLAADRNARNLFSGEIDYLHIYSTVYPDFAKAPDVPLISSRRIDPEFPSRLEAAFPGYEEKADAFDANIKNHELYIFYKNWVKRTDKRILELGDGKEVEQIQKELDALNAQYNAKKSAIESNLSSDPKVAEKIIKREEINKQYQRRFKELSDLDPKLSAANKLRNEAESHIRKIEEKVKKDARASADKEYAGFENRRRGIAKKLQQIIENYPPAVEAQKKRELHLQTRKGIKPNTPEFKKYLVKERQVNRGLASVRRKAPGYTETERGFHALNMEERQWVASKAKQNPQYEKMVAQRTKAQKIKHQLESSLRSHPDMAKLDMLRQKYDTRNDALTAVSKNTKELSKKITELESAIAKKRIETAVANNPDEFMALKGLRWGKRQYAREVPKQLKKRALVPLAEDKVQMKKALKFQQQKWHTEVDWDPRAFYELTEAKDKPIMKRWLARVKPYMYK